jgi:uncharacterized protein (DUF2147 family)
VIASLFFALAAAASTPEGDWTSPTGSITIRIAPCEPAAARWCGTVIAASDRAIADTRAAGGRELVGMMLVRDMRRVGPGHWRGLIEVPDQKVTARGALRLVGDDALDVKGCGLGGIVCKSQRWRRAD